jgi:hypothetical protein
MKGLISICFLVLFTISVQAQKKPQLNQEQLNLQLVKANTMNQSGIILTIIGSATFITGTVLLVTSHVDGEIDWGGGITTKTHDWRGGGVLLTGLGLTAIGIPLWIAGVIKKTHINKAMVGINVSASVNGIGLKIRF